MFISEVMGILCKMNCIFTQNTGHLIKFFSMAKDILVYDKPSYNNIFTILVTFHTIDVFLQFTSL